MFGAHDKGKQLAEEINTQFGLDVSSGEQTTNAELFLLLGYDWEE